MKPTAIPRLSKLRTAIVSHQARICVESVQAHNLLASYFGHDASSDRLPDALLRWMRASVDRLRQPSTARLQLLHLYITRPGRRLLIRMLLHPAGYMLLLKEQEERAELSRLMALGLTTRQAQILAHR
jgi:hypothetical protein